MRWNLIEIGLTANRGDATSHKGVARDLRALTNIPLKNSISKIKPIEFQNSNFKSPISITIKDSDCPRYSGLSISGITVKESPDWIKQKLKVISPELLSALPLRSQFWSNQEVRF